MITLCTLLTPFVFASQQVVNILWWPLTILGSPVPKVGTFLGPLVGCTF